jgi:hypothetical protein
MKCINCMQKEKDGVIRHKKGCPDWYRPNHETVVKNDK